MAAPLHVVFVGHVAQFSGAEIDLLRCIEAAEEDLRTTVVLAEDGPMAQALRDAGAEVEILLLSERVRGLRRTDVRAGREQAAAVLDVARYVGCLRRRLHELQPDVVSAVSLKAGVYGGLATRLDRLPFVWHLHDQITSSYLSRQAVLPMRAMIGTLPSAVISPSRATLEAVQWFRPGIRTAIIPHAIPFPPEPVPQRRPLRRIGIVGRLAPWKGQHIFLRAFAKAVQEADITAVVVGAPMFGEDEYARSLQQLVGELGLGERVDFRGFRRDVLTELRALDVFVHASVLTEPFGMAVFEAMAAGLPVIAADSGGLAEYLTHGRDGLLHAPGDVDQLAAMMRLLVDDDELRGRLATAGRELTRAFTPARTVARWRETYEEVLGDGAGAELPVGQVL